MTSVENILNYSKFLISQDKQEEALNILELNKFKYPNCSEIFFLIGSINFNFKNYINATKNFKISRDLSPKNPFVLNNLANTLKLRGLQSTAQIFYKKSETFGKNYPLFTYNKIINFPRIYKNEKEIEKYFISFGKNIQSLYKNYKFYINNQNILKELVYNYTNFLLPYTGKNIIDSQIIYSKYFEIINKNYFKQIDDLKIPKKFNKTLKIGFFSNYFRDHTINKEFKSFITNINKKKFDVYTFTCSEIFDEYTSQIKKNSNFYYTKDIVDLIKTIQCKNLDFLFFYEIGMSPESRMLSSFRLARIQGVFWGHPVSSGNSKIDYFISSELMETSNSNKYYTEKILKLPNIGIKISNKHKGYDKIDYTEKSFLVNQSLFKVLPNQDKIFAKIASRLSDYKINFIKSPNLIENRKFKKRLLKEFKKYEVSANNFNLLERSDEDGFLQYIKKTKIILDTFDWSGGLTSLQSISFNKPIVTLPSSMMRGRHSLAMLKIMDLDCLIAKNEDEYINIALKLANDEDYYEKICEKINKNKIKIFDDHLVIKKFEEFLTNCT